MEIAPVGLKPTRICTKCGVEKDTKQDFYWTTDKRGKRRPYSRCKPCFRGQLRDRYWWGRSEEEREASRRKVGGTLHPAGWRSRRKKYGITDSEWEAQWVWQGGRCAICLGPSGRHDLHVDHDHKTGRIRGLLCGRCNVGLGYFRDDVTALSQAVRYLANEGSQ